MVIDTEIRKRVKIEKKYDIRKYLPKKKMGHRRFKKETGKKGKKKLIHKA